MKDIFFIIVSGVLIYLGIATIFAQSDLMGSYGTLFAKYNQLYFGYVSFGYVLFLLIPLYLFYKNSKITFRRLELMLASFLMFFSILLAQSLLVSNGLRGKVASDFVHFLAPYIGVFGLWVFWSIITLVSFLIIVDKTTSDITSLIYLAFMRLFQKKSSHQASPIQPVEVKEEYHQKQEEVDFSTEYKNFQKDDKKDEEFEEEQQIDEVVKNDTKKEEDEKKVIQEKTKENDLQNLSDIILKKKEKLEQEEPEELKQEEIKKEEVQKPSTIIDEATKIKGQKASSVIVNELEENTKLLDSIEKGEVEKPKDFNLPSTKFLQKPNKKSQMVDENELDDKISYLIEKLAHFKIDGDVVRTYAGPVVSTFEFKPAANVKVSKILNLQDDLAMALSAETIRIQAPIPGKDVVGIEIPNDTVETIYLREILDSKLFQEAASPLTLALGKDIVGKPFITDLKKLPHLLIAGTTGSGKSVGINAMILSLLYKNSPDQLRLLMIDPKMLEFSTYNDIPHLLTPVITKPKQAIIALNNMVNEMERRYELMAESRTKNIENYNEKVKQIGGESFPYIVVIIDELADLMMTSGKDVELSIARLAQKARASGIHLIVATQRPSVDVVTGLIKANLPSRISYRVGQKIDSKIILDQIGAESLLGRGDMLFTPPGATGLVRLHAPWTTEEEIENIVEFIKSQREPNYDKSFLMEESKETTNTNEGSEELDELYNEALQVIRNDKKTSISYLQRKLQIGYNRSARIIEQLEHQGVLSAPNAKGIREIL